VEGAHDLGGIGGFGPVRTDDGDLTHHEPWELRAQVLALAACRGARPWIERLDPATYLTTTYYGRWLLAAERAVIDKEIVSSAALAEAQQQVRDGAEPPVVYDATLREQPAPRQLTPYPKAAARDPHFGVGDSVRVRRIYEPDRHHRVPRYVRGVVGTIERICGDEHINGHRTNVVEALDTVRFSSGDVWGERGDEAPFVILVDLWQSSLERVQST
jgi:hypothetical protein